MAPIKKMGMRFRLGQSVGLLVLFLLASCHPNTILESPRHTGPRTRFRVHRNGLFGFIDASGRIVVEPRFNDAWQFHEGLAAVQPDGETCEYIDEAGRSATGRFAGFCGFTARVSDGMIRDDKVGDNGDLQFGFRNREGTLTIPHQFEAASMFRNGVAGVSRKGKWGFIDKAGAFVIAPVYDDVTEGPLTGYYHLYGENRAGVKVGERWGFIDSKGALVIAPQYSKVERFVRGMALVRTSGGHFRFIDLEGRTVMDLPQQINMAECDADSDVPLCAGRVGEKWGFFTRDGRWSIEPTFEAPGLFAEGLAAVRHKGKWGYIDQNGTVVIDFKFSSASAFSGGIAEVVPTGVEYPEVGYIKPDGAFVWGPSK